MSSITCCAVEVTSNLQFRGGCTTNIVSQREICHPKCSETLVNYFEVVAVEVSDVGCVLTRAELRAYRCLALACSACLNRCSERVADLVLMVSNEAQHAVRFHRSDAGVEDERRHRDCRQRLDLSWMAVAALVSVGATVGLTLGGGCRVP